MSQGPREGPSDSNSSDLDSLAELLRRVHISVTINNSVSSDSSSRTVTAETPKPTAKAKASAASTSSASSGEPHRFYAVWRIPGHPEAAGVWYGPGVSAWQALEQILPDGKYIGSGAQLRRYDSLTEAIEAWRLEARRKRLRFDECNLFEFR